MARIQLKSGAYQSRSIISGAQRSVNLYAEANPDDEQAPVPITTYPTPGLTPLVQLPDVTAVRGLYRATNDEVYAVCGGSVYTISASWTPTKIGNIAAKSTPVCLQDNGLCLVIVDGSATGYVVDLTSSPRAVQKIQDQNFLGAVKAGYLDTYFLFNVPGTNQWFISLSNMTATMAATFGSGTAFNPLNVVAKTGGADPLSTLVCVHREAWLLGTRTSEVWIDAGTPDFPLGELPGVFIEHGCIAPYSVAAHDNIPFWLSQDKDGQGIVVMGVGYNAQRISTHAIEQYFTGYPTLSDAIGFCYQMQGHIFYVLAFPTANMTWVYELASKQWHQWASIDSSGNLNRHRSNCATSAFGLNVCGDYQNGYIYQIDPNAFTDNGVSIPRIRTFPHMLDDGRRLSYKSFIADLQSGQLSGGAWQQTPEVLGDFNSDFNSDFYKTQHALQLPIASLRWSDTHGASWSNPMRQLFGTTGQYSTSVKWSRLGMARDRLFELSWSTPAQTALNGAFVEVEEAET